MISLFTVYALYNNLSFMIIPSDIDLIRILQILNSYILMLNMNQIN